MLRHAPCGGHGGSHATGRGRDGPGRSYRAPLPGGRGRSRGLTSRAAWGGIYLAIYPERPRDLARRRRSNHPRGSRGERCSRQDRWSVFSDFRGPPDPRPAASSAAARASVRTPWSALHRASTERRTRNARSPPRSTALGSSPGDGGAVAPQDGARAVLRALPAAQRSQHRVPPADHRGPGAHGAGLRLGHRGGRSAAPRPAGAGRSSCAPAGQAGILVRHD